MNPILKHVMAAWSAGAVSVEQVYGAFCDIHERGITKGFSWQDELIRKSVLINMYYDNLKAKAQ